MTQREAILKHIRDFGSITPMQAFTDLGITKLATRISEMKRSGYAIRTASVRAENRYGKPIHFCRYSFWRKGKRLGGG